MPYILLDSAPYFLVDSAKKAILNLEKSRAIEKSPPKNWCIEEGLHPQKAPIL